VTHLYCQIKTVFVPGILACSTPVELRTRIEIVRIIH
jgi:hypothetical protein